MAGVARVAGVAKVAETSLSDWLEVAGVAETSLSDWLEELYSDIVGSFYFERWEEKLLLPIIIDQGVTLRYPLVALGLLWQDLHLYRASATL